MFAIIKTGGKQYVVSPGEKIKIEKLDASDGKEVSFDALLVSDPPAGGGTLVGTPYVKGYKVKAKVLAQGKGKKIIVYKYKAKKRYHKKQGHRQRFTEVEILSITKGVGGVKKVEKEGASSGGTKRASKSGPSLATKATKGRQEKSRIAVPAEKTKVQATAKRVASPKKALKAPTKSTE